MKILVTGAGGYLGSALVPELVSLGHEVFALDCADFGNPHVARPGWAPDGVRFELNKDLRSVTPGTFQDGDLDAVIHLAAITDTALCEKEAELAESIHVEGTKVAMSFPAAKRIHISTGSVYGLATGQRTESDAIKPVGVYDITKAKGEDVALAAGATVLRLNYLGGYAPGTRWQEVTNRLAFDAVVGKHVEVWDPDITQPFTNIHDAVWAIRLALLDAGLTGLFNVFSENMKRGKFCDFATEIGSQVATKSVGRARELLLDSSPFRRATGWETNMGRVHDGFMDAAIGAKREPYEV